MPTPERALWRSVIKAGLNDLQLGEDGIFHILKLPNSTMRKRAVMFFTDPEGMFFLIAPKLGLKPQAVVDSLRGRGLLNVIRNDREDEYWDLLVQVVGEGSAGGFMGTEADGPGGL